jgi:nucleotide-binding universal stress UspA family protein
MFNTIVVGTDGSETATIAVTRATALAEMTGATLHIVHAHRAIALSESAMAATAGVAVDVEGINKSLEVHANEVCDQAAVPARANGVKVQTHAAEGDPADALLAVARDVGADLLVVGNRGMSGKLRFVLGSVPNKVSHHCPCSLLIVDTASA